MYYFHKLIAITLYFTLFIHNPHNTYDRISIKTTDELPDNDIFKELPKNFTFSSGAGGRGISFALNPDGTFTGSYEDLELGAAGEGYANGTIYICTFEGQFSAPKPIHDALYSTKLKYFHPQEIPGGEYYQDNVRYIYSAPVGFEDGDTFLIYLPGCPLEKIPESFFSLSSINPEIRKTLPFGYYGMYNIREMRGFTGIAENSPWNKQYSYHYQNNSSQLWPRNSMIDLTFWPEKGPSSIDLSFPWSEDKQTEFFASDSKGTGDYSIALKFQEDYQSVFVSVKSQSGYDLRPWGGTVDGMLKAEFHVE